MRNLPWLWPGILVSIGLALIVKRAVARRFRTSETIALLLVIALGLVLSATLTPLRGAFEDGALGTGVCDFSRIRPLRIAELLRINDSSLNVVLFLPLGAVIGLLPRSRPRAALAAGAIALPFVVETVQLLVPILLRGCQSADVVDNLTGLTLGWLTIAVVRGATRLLTRD